MTISDWVPEPSSRFSLALEDVVELTTVGIDIGSSTSQLGFSRLELRNVDSRYVVHKREVLHESEIILTPLTDEATIDTAKLEAFFESEYQNAGITNDDIDSGALILTGLALAKHNARNIADIFAAHVGKFVAVSAGDAMESMLACRGAGVDEVSRANQTSLVHIDIGGGTTKLAYFDKGTLYGVAAIDIGARLIVVDDERRVVRIEPAGAQIVRALGLPLGVGDVLTDDARDAIAGWEGTQILAHAGLIDSAEPAEWLLRTQRLFPDGSPAIDQVSFSGGVSEYVFERESRTFGDLGRPIAGAVRRLLGEIDVAVVEAARGIRATVVGASQYSVQLSGSTVWVSAEELLPIRNIPVVNPHLDLGVENLDYGTLKTALTRALKDREPAPHTDAVAIVTSWQGSATYARLDALANAIVDSKDGELLSDSNAPIIIVCDADMAGLLGRHIQRITGDATPVIALDGVEVSELDFLDIGEFVPGTGSLPMVIKSLLFPTPRAQAGQAGA